MSLFNKFFKKIIHLIILIVLTSCKLQEPYKNHGILHLEKRSEVLIVNSSNSNDVLKVIGQPHTISLDNENEWLYFERVLTKGEFLKLGQNVLKTNNILLLKFDKYGILIEKELVGKNSKNKIVFSKDRTSNNLSQKSFVEKFLSSLKTKMYGNK